MGVIDGFKFMFGVFLAKAAMGLIGLFLASVVFMVVVLLTTKDK